MTNKFKVTLARVAEIQRTFILEADTLLDADELAERIANGPKGLAGMGFCLSETTDYLSRNGEWYVSHVEKDDGK